MRRDAVLAAARALEDETLRQAIADAEAGNHSALSYLRSKVGRSSDDALTFLDEDGPCTGYGCGVVVMGAWCDA